MSPGTLSPSTDPEAVLRHHARSFSWAAQLLPPRTRRDAATLYAFCRTVDDIADDAAASSDDTELVAIREALLNQRDDHPVAGPLIDLVHRWGIPEAAAITLIDGVRSDLGGLELETTDELIDYAYRVAGTVGLMMRPLLGVTDSAADPFAVDLGIAMQLTNIARDVVEDAERGRRYLPSDQLGGPVAPNRLAAADPVLRHQGYHSVVSILDLADAYYASAERGMAYIPRRSRLAIRVAARLYRAIGDRIRAMEPPDYWQQRAVVPITGKIRLTVAGVGASLLPEGVPAAPHEPSLHQAIAGAPGTDPQAAAT